MSNDKRTLPDPQPGGRARLGVQDERARFEAILRWNPLIALCASTAWQVWQAALSAQPSQGGQDALAALVEASEDMRAASEEIDNGEGLAHAVPYALWNEFLSKLDDAEQALAAREPVGATEKPNNLGGIELTTCQLREALLMAGSPELDVPFEDRGRVRIFQNETGHSGPGLYCECVDVEEEGCILLDGTSPAIASPADAVDLGQSTPPELHAVTAALKQFDECAEDCDSEGCDIGRAWFDALTTMGLLRRTQRSPAAWTITAEGKRLLALIDSQAVGNG